MIQELLAMEFPTRRRFLNTALTVLALPLVESWPGHAVAQPTPSCGGEGPTRPETEGPYFKPRSPERWSLLESGMKGRLLILTGSVITTACRPVARALLDFWQADASGEYDNTGFRLRGHQYSETMGRYRLETVVPGRYVGRTRHIHVKVQAPGGSALTTQLYFPGEPANVEDWLFRRQLLMAMSEDADRLHAQFGFVVRV
jgi:protocatechuate 3,4-dioxygenase beta subunit